MAGRSSVIAVTITGDDAPLRRALGSAESGVSGFARTASRAFIGFGIAAGAGVAATVPLINAASDLSEEMSKADQIFGDAAASIRSFADTSAESLGISETAALQAASNFGQFGIAAGLAGDDLSVFSTDLLTAAADMASFNNLTIDEALGKIQSGLAGSSEPLREVGVFLTAAAVEAKALEMGMGDLSGELTEGEKVMARQALILEQLGANGALGDFARTSDGLANTQRILAARFADVQAELGLRLLPVALLAADAALDLMDAFEGVIRVFERDGLAGVVSEAGDAFSEFAPIALGHLRDFAAAAVSWIAETAPLVGAQLLTWADEFIDWVAPMIPPFLAELAGWAADAGEWIVKTGLPTAVKALSRWADAFIDWVAPMIPPFLAELGDAAVALSAWIRTNVAPKIPGWLQTWGGAFVKWVFTDFIPTMGRALDEVEREFAKWMIEDLGPEIGAWLGMIIDNEWEEFKEFGKQIVLGIVEGIKGALPLIGDALKIDPASIAADVLPGGGIIDDAKDFGGSILDGVLGGGGGFGLLSAERSSGTQDRKTEVIQVVLPDGKVLAEAIRDADQGAGGALLPVI